MSYVVVTAGCAESIRVLHFDTYDEARAYVETKDWPAVIVPNAASESVEEYSAE